MSAFVAEVVQRVPALELMTDQGAALLAEWVDEPTEAKLLSTIDASPWRDDLRRRTQHYGWRYDYKARRVDPSMRLGALPSWAAELAGRIFEQGLCEREPDQVIVNEYLPGQGIAAHVDCLACFGPTILSLSLRSTCIIEFIGPSHQKAAILLPPRSLLVLSGNSRTDWAHRIAARRSDVVDGTRIERSRRVSLTFRTMREVAP